MTVPSEKAPANYVPAAAVIRRGQALSRFTGRSACRRLVKCDVKSSGSTRKLHCKLAWLECRRGKRNSRCSGEMRRYLEEHQWRRRLPGLQLTLRRESVGSEPD